MTTHILDRLVAVIDDRRRERPDGSYVASLLDGGPPAAAEKVVEEAGELAEAAQSGTPDSVAHEAADLLFHALVLIASADVPAADVWAELERRFGTSGLDEKAARDA